MGLISRVSSRTYRFVTDIHWSETNNNLLFNLYSKCLLNSSQKVKSSSSRSAPSAIPSKKVDHTNKVQIFTDSTIPSRARKSTTTPTPTRTPESSSTTPTWTNT